MHVSDENITYYEFTIILKNRCFCWKLQIDSLCMLKTMILRSEFIFGDNDFY